MIGVRKRGPTDRFFIVYKTFSTDPTLHCNCGPIHSLAPERLLVFEVTGSVQNFANAVARIAGLEFAGEEELVADEFDENPEYYLLVLS